MPIKYKNQSFREVKKSVIIHKVNKYNWVSNQAVWPQCPFSWSPYMISLYNYMDCIMNTDSNLKFGCYRRILKVFALVVSYTL